MIKLGNKQLTKNITKLERIFKVFKYQYRKCEKTWYGWAQTNICPGCGGQLEEIETNNKNNTQNKENKLELSQTRS